MPAPYNGGAQFRVTMQGTLGLGDVWGNTYQFMLQTDGVDLTFAQVVADMDEVVEQVCDVWALFQNPLWLWDRYSVAELDDAVVSGVVSMTNPVIGLQAGDLLPTQTTLQVAFPTGRAGRILKKAIPGLSEVLTTAGSGNWLPETVAAANAAAAMLLLPIEASNGAWLYMYNNKSGAPDEIVFPQAVKTSPVPKVQRRRRLG